MRAAHPRRPDGPRGDVARLVATALALLALGGCASSGGSGEGPSGGASGSGGAGGGSGAGGAPPLLTAVTFNTGSTKFEAGGVFGRQHAEWSDEYYGNGLAFEALITDTRAFFDRLRPDVVAFQEIFHPEECVNVPEEAREGFVCATWQPGDPTVAQRVLGPEYQIACQLEKPDECLAVRRGYGTFLGCDRDVCLDGLAGARVEGCGRGSRVGRGVVALAEGGELTVVNVHGTSGVTAPDQQCRVKQVRQVFVDLGDGSGRPAASGERNLILGDFNVDPGRMTDLPDAQEWLAHAGPGKRFHFVTPLGPETPATYAGFFSIDHMVSDAFTGTCVTPGLTEGVPPVSPIVAFDHKPQVCALR